jgi:NADH:ubiquinone oxidoreductase subunit 6 (subunit J)
MKKHAHLLALSGISSPILLLTGIAMAVFKLNRSTSTVDLSDPVKVKKVIASIELFNQQIGQAFSSFILAFILAIALLLPFLIAVIKLGYRRPWAFYFSLIYGIVLL